MSLVHRIEKYLDDNDKPAADFSGPILIVNDHRTKDIDGNATFKDGNGDRIFAWNESTYGRKPTISQLPADAVSVNAAKTRRNADKINRAEFLAVDNLPDLLTLLEPCLDKLNMFEEE